MTGIAKGTVCQSTLVYDTYEVQYEVFEPSHVIARSDPADSFRSQVLPGTQYLPHVEYRVPTEMAKCARRNRNSHSQSDRDADVPTLQALHFSWLDRK